MHKFINFIASIVIKINSQLLLSVHLHVAHTLSMVSCLYESINMGEIIISFCTLRFLGKPHFVYTIIMQREFILYKIRQFSLISVISHFLTAMQEIVTLECSDYQFNNLDQWFFNFLILPTYHIVSHVMVTLKHKMISMQVPNCKYAIL